MGVDKIKNGLVLPGCAGDDDAPDFDDYDDMGYMVAEGGYKAARFGLEKETPISPI